MTPASSPSAELKDARVLVLGAAGFIGRWVARGAYAVGAHVHGVVHRPTAIAPIAREMPAATFAARDVAEPGAIEEIVREVRPDVVFNLVGYGVDPGERDETAARAINTTLVARLADACARLQQVQPHVRLIHVGSALEYGTLDGEVTEATRPNPTTLYGRTKLAGSLALQSRCDRSGLLGMVARLFTVYGPGEHPARLLPSLMAASLTTDRIPLTSGRQKRDFAYVEDVTDALVRLATAPVAPGAILHVASGVVRPVRVFVETAARELGIHPSRLCFDALPMRSDETNHASVSVARLNALIGCTPSADLAAGIARAIRRSGLTAHAAPRP